MLSSFAVMKPVCSPPPQKKKTSRAVHTDIDVDYKALLELVTTLKHFNDSSLDF